MEETQFTLYASIFLIILLALLVRLIVILPSTSSRPLYNAKSDPDEDENRIAKKIKLMILLGSGGHTGEMLRILEQWGDKINKYDREYVLSTGDTTSIIKLKNFEKNEEFLFFTLHRARNIGEGKLKALFNTTISFIKTISKLIQLKEYPDVFLCNGPGTSIPIAYTLFLLKFFGLCRTKIIYVESLARVKELSLTGILILPICDKILVQWKDLAKKYRRCEYYGILV